MTPTELRALAAAANLPWVSQASEDEPPNALMYGPDGDSFAYCSWNPGNDYDVVAMAAYACAAANAVPDLLDRLERLEPALRRLVESVQQLETVDDDGEAADFWTVPPEPLELARAALDRLHALPGWEE